MAKSSIFWRSLKFCPRWALSLVYRNVLEGAQPWLTYAAIEFLEQVLTSEMRLFEYGAGGSTLFYAGKVREVFSVEHDRRWYEKVAGKLNQIGYQNCCLKLIEPEPASGTVGQSASDPDAYVSGAAAYRDKTFKAYARAIEEHPEQYFDVIVIDGRARPSCFKHAVKRLKPRGFLVLDNSERDRYASIHQTLNPGVWAKKEFWGPGPYNLCFWKTSIWQNRSDGTFVF
ncbi:MAG: hypothetical protein PHN49_00610 [Candidatus Omnitrophica bacterium]|nr:hypothetical protein [Candidatus Omnitrophota bacterium]MDD5670123.1 hypothetical protein [Candidatus Omnitrophota bacterium]